MLTDEQQAELERFAKILDATHEEYKKALDNYNAFLSSVSVPDANEVNVEQKQRRRATEGYIYAVDANVLVSEPEEIVSKPTELESLIMLYFKSTRRKLNKTLKAALNEAVVSGGATYPSPDQLFNEDEDFKDFVASYCKSLVKLPNANINQAIYGLRKYATPKYGWLEFKQSLTKNAPSTIVNREDYVD